jgi:Ser/Thr protein kinase RdoA (MazF antagonist)
MTLERADEMTARLHATLPAFFDFLGDSLLPAQRDIYERILASSFTARATRRLVDLDRVTLVHGDVHSGNVLLPHRPEDGVKLVDWQLWDIGNPAFDLAFFMALHWSPPLRAAWELPLLRSYHQRLLSAGIRDYTWQDLFDDYRRAVVTMVLIPIGQFRRRNPAGTIWFGMQDATAAYQDLHCEDVLDC